MRIRDKARGIPDVRNGNGKFLRRNELQCLWHGTTALAGRRIHRTTEAKNWLEQGSGRVRDVLVAYYIRRDRDDVTGDRLGYAKDYVRQIRRKALEEYAKRNNLPEE